MIEHFPKEIEDTIKEFIGYTYFQPKKYHDLKKAIRMRLIHKSQSMNVYGDPRYWDTSLIKNMSCLFLNIHYFDGDISHWDVSNVTEMHDMFSHKVFKKKKKNKNKDFKCDVVFDPNLENWDVSNVRNMKGMFTLNDNCTHSIANWNISNVTDMSYMFYNSSIRSIKPWKIKKTTFIENMFSNDLFSHNDVEEIVTPWCKKSALFRFTPMSKSELRDAIYFDENEDRFSRYMKIGPIHYWNTEYITDMSSLFAGSTMRFFNEDISDWNVSNVTNMSCMFMHTTDFNQNIGNWNVSNVTDLSYMFYNAKEFNQNIDNWDVSNVTDITGIFCKSQLFNQPLDSWNVQNVIYLSSFIHNASSFKQDISSWNDKLNFSAIQSAPSYTKYRKYNVKDLRELCLFLLRIRATALNSLDSFKLWDAIDSADGNLQLLMSKIISSYGPESEYFDSWFRRREIFINNKFFDIDDADLKLTFVK